MAADPNVKPSGAYVFFAVIAVALGVVIGQWAVHAAVSYAEPAVGISVFAVLYVLAQAVERLVEWIITAIDLVSDTFAEGAKKRALAKLTVANSTANGNPVLNDFGITADNATQSESEAKTEVGKARKDLSIFGQALSFSFAYMAVSYFEYGIFKVIGVSNLVEGVDRLFTALAVMGGSKALHDLISKIQKSKEKDETPTASPSLAGAAVR
jgi:hypothetical protein